jgi:hypothetical protein
MGVCFLASSVIVYLIWSCADEQKTVEMTSVDYNCEVTFFI